MVRDPDHVLASLAEATRQERETVDAIVSAVRAVVDDLLADGNVVALETLILSFGDSPTRQALRERLASPEPVPNAVLHLDHHAVADWLGLPFDVYAERPLATRALVGAEVFDLLGEQAPNRPAVWDVLETWDASFADGRAYKVSSVGLEAAVEHWLVENLDRLTEHGYPVALQHRQHKLPSGRRPDLLCRFSEHTDVARTGDWLVVELKATRFYDGAAGQIEGYLAEVSEHMAVADERVHGLLVTDGADHAEVELLRERGVTHLSLASLGYRLALAQERAPSTAASLSVDPHRLPSMSTLSDQLFTPVEPDGPETYWVRLFHDVDSSRDDEEREREVAASLWRQRQSRRERYERDYGEPREWPAAHPATVIKLHEFLSPVKAAVCIRCDWLARAFEDGHPVDLHDAAKGHALAHPHDSRLERGVNPPKKARDVREGMDARFAEARANARRAARRVAERHDD